MKHVSRKYSMLNVTFQQDIRSFTDFNLWSLCCQFSDYRLNVADFINNLFLTFLRKQKEYIAAVVT